MKQPNSPVNRHQAYHAHVYFDQDSAAVARRLTQQAGDLFDVKVGRFHEKLVGPHQKWSCQISFASDTFDNVIRWLDGNRQGLSVLVHGVTGDDLKDHTDYAYWLGDSVELNLEMFTG